MFLLSEGAEIHVADYFGSDLRAEKLQSGEENLQDDEK
jgi:hypothetical protein